MRKPYLIILGIQYALWGLYVASLIGVYILGFSVDTLNVRWVLVPETLIIVSVSIALSFTLVVMFIAQRVRRDIPPGDRFGVIGVAPSVLVVCGAFLWFVARLF